MAAKSKSTAGPQRKSTSQKQLASFDRDPTGVPLAASSGDSPSLWSRSPDPRDGQTVWLSAPQAAARAGNSTRTIKRWIEAKYLQATRLPSPKGMGPLRIRLGDLEALIARGALS